MKDEPTDPTIIEYSSTIQGDPTYATISQTGKFFTGQAVSVRYNPNSVNTALSTGTSSDANFQLNSKATLEVTPKIPFIWLIQRSAIPFFTYQINDECKVITKDMLKQQGTIIWNLYTILMAIAICIVILLILFGIYKSIRRWCKCCCGGEKKKKKNKRSAESASSSESSSSSYYKGKHSKRKSSHRHHNDEYYLGER